MEIWKNKDIGAVGNALTTMIEAIVVSMLLPIKEQMKAIVDDISNMMYNITINQEKIAEVYSTLQATLTDMISNIEVEQQTELMQRVTELQTNLDDLKADVESNTEDCANSDSKTESIELDIANIKDKLRTLGDI